LISRTEIFASVRMAYQKQMERLLLL
jgi:hypothetical protein